MLSRQSAGRIASRCIRCVPRADLDVALYRRLGERVEQPARIVIPHQPVPFAADDRDRRADLRRVIGELAVPGLDDLAERAERRLDPGGIARAALGIAVEIALAPVLEMKARQHRRLVRRNIFDEALPLILRGHDAPGRKRGRRLIAPRPAARRSAQTAPAGRPARMRAGEQAAGIEPQECEISESFSMFWWPRMKRTAASSCFARILRRCRAADVGSPAAPFPDSGRSGRSRRSPAPRRRSRRRTARRARTCRRSDARSKAPTEMSRRAHRAPCGAARFRCRAAGRKRRNSDNPSRGPGMRKCCFARDRACVAKARKIRSCELLGCICGWETSGRGRSTLRCRACQPRPAQFSFLEITSTGGRSDSAG